MTFSFNGEPVTVPGNQPKLGMKLPTFSVVDAKNQTISAQDLLIDKPLLISVVPNINTSVCSLQTKHFNETVDQHPNVNFVTISTNTVEEQSNWCAAENVENMKMLSDVAHDFGDAMGLYVPELKLNLRSVWIINPNGMVKYSEILHDQGQEPNYAEALKNI
ncbi:peroxiredoxin [Weissella koreensis]|uniref:thiol peroxidase n=1 Tax=Weissella koreensis TaxID=165096 RepID=UPI0022BA4DDA|nr:peroxiredoxin [Weissella koreensis]MCZ9311188.1 peroxiredoxin [Weissella koreensis]